MRAAPLRDLLSSSFPSLGSVFSVPRVIQSNLNLYLKNHRSCLESFVLSYSCVMTNNNERNGHNTLSRDHGKVQQKFEIIPGNGWNIHSPSGFQKKIFDDEQRLEKVLVYSANVSSYCFFTSRTNWREARRLKAVYARDIPFEII